jgi:hypothetical protein
MKITKLDIESGILGREVYQIEEIKDGRSFLDLEVSIINEYKPFYIQCMFDAGDLSAIHSMEDAGFRFAEFRLKKLLDINAFQSVSELAYFPYYVTSFRDKVNFKKAQQILKTSSQDDRFSRDPAITDDLSQKRLQGYLKKSFDNEQSEFLYGLFNRNTDELLGFKTIEIKNENQVVIFQTAIDEELDIKKFNYMLDVLIISKLIENGFNNFYAITSGLNLMEMDLHLSTLKYKNISSSVILRKVYT